MKFQPSCIKGIQDIFSIFNLEIASTSSNLRCVLENLKDQTYSLEKSGIDKITCAYLNIVIIR